MPLPAMEEELRHRRGDAAAEERLQALLADSRRTLARLLAVADKLAPVAVAQDIAQELCARGLFKADSPDLRLSHWQLRWRMPLIAWL